MLLNNALIFLNIPGSVNTEHIVIQLNTPRSVIEELTFNKLGSIVIEHSDTTEHTRESCY